MSTTEEKFIGSFEDVCAIENTSFPRHLRQTLGLIASASSELMNLQQSNQYTSC
ncbi:MAG: hypothetical protein VKK42_16915 [Lyngbya sp.]|nr:hypothetical protein [Lyngbya sp.]